MDPVLNAWKLELLTQRLFVQWNGNGLCNTDTGSTKTPVKYRFKKKKAHRPMLLWFFRQSGGLPDPFFPSLWLNEHISVA